jgi:putative transposase
MPGIFLLPPIKTTAYEFNREAAMPSRNCVFTADSYYHILNRGNNREDIFSSDDNYQFFYEKLMEHLAGTGIFMPAYCLMPNHFHLLFYLEVEADVSGIMQSFTTSYAKSYNSILGKTGHLFGGRFRSVEVDSLDQLMQLCRYIHLNPVKAGLVKKAQLWKYSDYRQWISRRNVGAKEMKLRDALFSTGMKYKLFVEEGMEPAPLTKQIKKILIDCK